jgi:hypothetical protein
MTSEQQYCESIRRETSLFANWPPDAPRKIGDFGRVQGAMFQFMGSLDPEEIEALGSRESASRSNYDIMIKSSRSMGAGVSAGAKVAKVAKGKAVLRIKFDSADGVVFAAPSVRITEIASLEVLGRTLKERMLEGNWDPAYAVVVQISVADRATVILSSQSGASMDFEVDANAPVNAELVAELNAGASQLSSQGVGINIVGHGPITPLFKLAFLQRRILGGSKIAYRDAVAPGEQDVDVHDVDEEHVLVLI